MATFSKKVMGKEVGDASVYAQPHNMNGKAVSGAVVTQSGAEYMREMNPGVGVVSKGNYPETKTTGIKIRGTGAAIKGTMARGPMG